MRRYRVVDIDGVPHEAATLEEAEAIAQGLFDDCDGEWPEEITSMEVLLVVAKAERVNERPCDCGDHDYHCEYQMVPLKETDR